MQPAKLGALEKHVRVRDRAGFRAQIIRTNKYAFMEDLGFTLPHRNVVRESTETSVDRRTRQRRHIGGKEVQFLTAHRQCVWIHERHLLQSDMEYELQHSQLPFFVLSVVRVERNEAGTDLMVTLELQSELSTFSPYTVTHTLAGWKQDLTREIGAWVELVASRRDGAVLPVQAPVALGTTVNSVSRSQEQVEWRSLATRVAAPATTQSDPTLVIHLLPGVEHRGFLAGAVGMRYAHGGEMWASRVQLAPQLAHPEVGQKSLLPRTLAPLADSVQVLFVAVHTDGDGLVLTWAKDYALDCGLVGDMVRPCEAHTGDSMARLLQELIGARKGLSIVLLCCGVSEVELRHLTRLCRKVECCVVLPGAARVEYLSPFDPTLREFSSLADAWTRVAVQLGGPIPPVAALEMSREILQATSLRAQPPLFLAPNGARRVLSAAAKAAAYELADLTSEPAKLLPELSGVLREAHTEAEAPGPAAAQSGEEQRSTNYGKVRKQSSRRAKRHGGGNPGVTHTAQLSAVQMGSADLLPRLHPSVQAHLGAKQLAVLTAQVAGTDGRRTLLFACQGMDGSDHDAYRKRTVNYGRDLQAVGAQLLHVSSADAAQLEQVLRSSSVGFNAPLVVSVRKVFMLGALGGSASA